LTRSHFDRLIDARERDLDDRPSATLAALEDYAEATSSLVMKLALEIIGASTPAAIEAARRVGIAYALAGLLRAMPFHAATGRCYIPDDLVAMSGLDLAEYAARQATPALRKAVASFAQAASSIWPPRTSGVRYSARGAARAVASGHRGRALRRLERARFDPFAPNLALPDPAAELVARACRSPREVVAPSAPGNWAIGARPLP